MLQLSLRTVNFKLFENISFGIAHLSRDGLHLNASGKDVLSGCWVYSILVGLNFKGGPLPLSYRFRKIVDDFRARNRKLG